MFKRLKAIAVLLVIIILFTPIYANAEDKDAPNYNKALVLNRLGLFLGTENGFELERPSKRIEAGVMVIRLLGKESYAREKNLSHPFTDVPQWGSPYTGYMYQNNITTGTSQTLYSSDESISAIQYVTFILRALGYDDRLGDFSYPAPMEKAVEVGLLNTSEYNLLKSKEAFLRDDMVLVSHNALSVKLKNSGKILIERLVEEDEAVSLKKAIQEGMYTLTIGDYGNKPLVSSDYGYIANSKAELVQIMKQCIEGVIGRYSVDIRGYAGNPYDDFAEAFMEARRLTELETGIISSAKSWSYISKSVYVNKKMDITTGYYYTLDNYIAMLDEAYNTAALIIDKDMDEYSRVKVIHDYVVENTCYDIEGYNSGNIPPESFTAYGALVLGKAVCQGYAEAVNILCAISGIECLNISGKAVFAEGDEGHAWNIVRIDGNYYHLDATFDDPTMKDGSQLLFHHYLNLSDTDISIDHSWNNAEYPPCNSTQANYFTRENLTALNKDDYYSKLNNELNNGKTDVTYKILDYNRAEYNDIGSRISSKVKSYYIIYEDNFGVIKIYNIQYR